MPVRIATHLSDVSEIRAVRDLLLRQVQERCGDSHPAPSLASYPATPIELDIEPGIGPEGFRIADGAGGGVRITGNDSLGLLYGVGKLLRDSHYRPGAFVPGDWRGTSVPAGTLRGMYFATHFHNYYHEAPVEEIERYVEEIALWGVNTICVWFDRHHFEGINAPDAAAMLQRLRAILAAAKRIGLRTSLLLIANEAYANSPVEMRAQWSAGQNGYISEPAGHYHVELCPHQAGARELLLRWHEEIFARFRTVGLDYICIWPYDQGGCTCKLCSPWGSNGYLQLAEETANVYRRHFPRGEVVLSTWYFDRFTSGEWPGLAHRFSAKPTWANYVLADDHGERYPQFPLQHGVPGNLPLINFPEISMWGTGGWGPWGGFGASPLPHHLQRLWQQQRAHVVGGFPYSEGIFEDMSKVVCTRFYWDPDSVAMDTIREYCAYEFGTEAAAPVSRAVEILERNLERVRDDQDGVVRFVLSREEGAAEAQDLLREADEKMTARARQCWRWRLLLLRAQIDVELVQHDFAISPACEAAMRELTRLYHAQNAASPVAPPTREALRNNRPI